MAFVAILKRTATAKYPEQHSRQPWTLMGECLPSLGLHNLEDKEAIISQARRASQPPYCISTSRTDACTGCITAQVVYTPTHIAVEARWSYQDGR